MYQYSPTATNKEDVLILFRFWESNGSNRSPMTFTNSNATWIFYTIIIIIIKIPQHNLHSKWPLLCNFRFLYVRVERVVLQIINLGHPFLTLNWSCFIEENSKSLFIPKRKNLQCCFHIQLQLVFAKNFV
jgi:hypothetical protein